ncbi:MAG: hypothetical protein GQE15_40530 [Archangiaceae bacterium]|nr:hypothetical protein [Archangiaceae bacterium]
MAVSPLRAVVTAHLEGSFNRARKQFGTLGVVASAVIIAIAFLLFVVPFVAGLSFMGFLLGGALQGEGQFERNLSAISIFLTSLTLLGGAFAGIGGASRQLPWESLQAYPVSPRALFAAELVAGSTEVLALAELLALLGVCAGVSVAAPQSTPFMLLIFLCCVVTTMSVQLLVASVAQRVSKQVRIMFVVLPIMATLLSFGSPKVMTVLTSKRQTEVGVAAQSVGRLLPVGQALEAARSAYQGAWSEVPLKLVPMVALMLGTLVVAYVLVSREKPMAQEQGKGVAKKLWTFTSPTWGIARLQWETLTTSLPGRMMLLMPPLTIVLIRGPLAQLLNRGSWVVPAAFLYAGLSSTNLLFNQFGLDRHGVKALFLLPVDERAVLEGKQWAFGAWQSVQTVMLAGLMLVSGYTDGWALFLGVAIAACSFFLISSVGQFVSIWQPHPLTKSGMRGMRPPLVVVLATMATVFGGGGVLFFASYSLFQTIPQWSGVVMSLVAVLLAIGSRGLLRFNTGFLKVSRERLVESLGATA